jgi:hypothetical protein
MLAQVLDRIIAFAARRESELLAAREEWAERAGRVFDDDPLYEERTTAFLEWFALDRPSTSEPGDTRRPAERFLAEEPLDDLEGRWAHALGRSHRSLFLVRELGKGRLLLEDLLGGAQLEVTERRRLPGIAEGELFEARVVANVASPPELLFTRAFQFHPREASAELKRIGADARERGVPREETLFRLLRARLKALRYGHVAPARIYAEEK